MGKFLNYQNERILDITKNANNFATKTKWSQSRQIINSTKDDQTGDVYRTIYTEQKTQPNSQNVSSITTLLTRTNIIGISIFAISLYGIVDSYTKQDLIDFMPNYETRNEFIPIEDPESINYVQFGQPVVNNLTTFITELGSWGQFANDFWTSFSTFLGLNTNAYSYSTTTTSFISNFGESRWDVLRSMLDTSNSYTIKDTYWDIYQVLTASEKNYLSTTNPIYFGGYDDRQSDFLTDNPYNFFTHSVFLPFGTKPWNNEYGILWNMPSLVELIRGNY